MNYISKNIRYLRLHNEYSQSRLAELVGTSRTVVTGWESGKSYPVVDTIIQLSNLFKVSLDSLMKVDLTKFPTLDQIQDYDKRNNKSLPCKNLLVPVKAQANYTQGYHQDLKTVRIPGIPDDVEARTFEVSDRAMFPILQEGDLLSCLRHTPHEGFPANDVFVIVTRYQGILIGFIRSVHSSELELTSQNFAPVRIQSEKISEIWRAKYKITRHFTTAQKTALESRVERLEDLIRKKLGE